MKQKHPSSETKTSVAAPTATGIKAETTLYLINALFGLTLTITYVLAVFFSRNYNFDAESISIAALLRLSRSLPYLSEVDEVPAALNSFTPFIYWLVQPFLRLSGAKSLESVALCGHLVMSGVCALYILAVAYFCRRTFAGISRPAIFFALCFAFLFFPTHLQALRPDILSFFLEFLGVAVLYSHLQKEGGSDSSKLNGFILAAILVGLGTAVKLNTVGALLGVVLFFLLRKELVKSLNFFAIAVLSSLSALALCYLAMGKPFFSNMLGTTNNQIVSIGDLKAVVEFSAIHLLLKRSLFYIFLFAGLYQIRKKHKAGGELLCCVLLTSFLVASAGQLKVGAALNYFVGFFVLGSVPVAYSAEEFFLRSKERLTDVLALGLTPLLLCNSILAALLPLDTTINLRVNYPFEEAKQYVERNFPEGYIYSSNRNANLYFFDRSPLAPWTERFFEITPQLAPELDLVKEKIRETGYFRSSDRR